MNEIIKQISTVLTEAGIEHFCDPQNKNWKIKSYGHVKYPEGVTYYRIHTKKIILYFVITSMFMFYMQPSQKNCRLMKLKKDMG